MRIPIRLPSLVALVLSLPLSFFLAGCYRTAFITRDVCVYGGTSAGVVAAVQAARMGRSVVLVEPGQHLGGLSSGGLGATDIGNKKAIGGIAREFYRRLGRHYGKDEAWTFEPHVAEETFQSLVEESHVLVLLGHRMASIERWGVQIRNLELEDLKASGFASWSFKTVNARMFIDASYEGDLMAAAGVTYTVGRESNAEYGETLNGIRPETPYHQFDVPVDPWIEPGDPSSGLLPFIQDGDGGVPGEGDHRVQAYNFRLCLTRDPANLLPIEPPGDYDPARYELLARYLEALVAAGRAPKLDDLLSSIRMPGGKTDTNNKGPFSTDYIGGSWDYPEADPAERVSLRKEHERYTRGFLHFLATSPRVPAQVREEMRSWGLAKDEFVTTGGWPHQLYIREARRMVSDYVTTEKDCRGIVKASDSVGLGAHNMDSHNCQRIVKDGRVRNEGDVQVRVQPYPISYRSIIPRADECVNLLVPVCLSASHIAFGSIRMEPVFMILGQSAATAACLALEGGCDIQDVDRGKLKARLLADGQVLEWTEGPATREGARSHSIGGSAAPAGAPRLQRMTPD
jgi:hypothetical protein